MKLFGITGGIGMGKSTTGVFLQKSGVEVVDTDLLARQLVEPGQPAFLEIATAFGPSVLSSSGGLDRRQLGRCVFADAEARARLESILHPKIRDLWQGQVKAWREAGSSRAAVIIPLLFETGAESYFDSVICVACSPAAQRARLEKRGWSEVEIQQRLSAQWPVKEKIDRSDFVIWTDATLEAHAAQAAAVCQ
ncbi:MAG TPA: dephospho-CoA kinase [Candidatus Saccharimonadales bacterium]|nr:dephospho-CoA kinase [Candidatus Saccharimonadales bacterium]